MPILALQARQNDTESMVSFSLEMHPDFEDFNFSSIWNPTGGTGVSARALFRLVYEARQGRSVAKRELSNVIECTLRKAAFEAYQRAHGPLAVDGFDWLCAKLSQFSESMLYERLTVVDESLQDYRREVKEPWNQGLQDRFFVEGSRIYEEEIRDYLVPEENRGLNYGELVDMVSQAEPAKRKAAFRQWLRQEKQARIAASREAQPSWGKNQKRNEVIIASLARDIAREQICAELDRRGVPVNLPWLEANGFQTWTAAWEDAAVGRPPIQRLVSKVQKTVKSRTVSE